MSAVNYSTASFGGLNSGLLSTSVQHLAQDVLLHLAGRCPRQLAHKDKLLGRLEPRHVRLGPCDELTLTNHAARTQLDEGDRHLSPVVVVRSHHGCLLNELVPLQGILNLNRADVLPTRYDDILRPIFDLNRSVGMEDSDIASMEDTALKGLPGARLVQEVPFHDDVALDHHLTQRLAVGGHLALGPAVKHRDVFGDGVVGKMSSGIVAVFCQRDAAAARPVRLSQTIGLDRRYCYCTRLGVAFAYRTNSYSNLLFESLHDSGGRRSASGHVHDLMVEFEAVLIGQHRDHYHRSPGKVLHLMPTNTITRCLKSY